MYKTIIFDFDFTLADSSKGVFKCINYALKKLSFLEVSLTETNRTIGLSLEDTFEKLTGENNPNLKNQFKRLFIEHADRKMSKYTFVYKTVPETIKFLKEKSITLGIVSTKFRYRIFDILEKYKLNAYFNLIIGGEDVIKNKPNPEGVDKLINSLLLKKEECVLIGDSIVDEKTAVNAGISFIPILTGTTKKEDFKKCSYPLYLNEFHDIVKYSIWE